MARPNYETIRDKTPFRWRVNSTDHAFFALVDVPLRQVNLHSESMIELVRRGRPLFRHQWGDRVPIPSLSTPAISYGHINGLGADLIFPEGGEVSFTKICGSLHRLRRVCDEPVMRVVSTAELAVVYKTFGYSAGEFCSALTKLTQKVSEPIWRAMRPVVRAVLP